MYTFIYRRRVNRERLHDTQARAQREFFPKLQQAPGFIGFYLVADQATNLNISIVVWESKAHADAFQPQVDQWTRVLESLGSHEESSNHGETVVEITPQL